MRAMPSVNDLRAFVRPKMTRDRGAIDHPAPFDGMIMVRPVSINQRSDAASQGSGSLRDNDTAESQVALGTSRNRFRSVANSAVAPREVTKSSPLENLMKTASSGVERQAERRLVDTVHAPSAPCEIIDGRHPAIGGQGVEQVICSDREAQSLSLRVIAVGDATTKPIATAYSTSSRHVAAVIGSDLNERQFGGESPGYESAKCDKVVDGQDAIVSADSATKRGPLMLAARSNETNGEGLTEHGTSRNQGDEPADLETPNDVAPVLGGGDALVCDQTNWIASDVSRSAPTIREGEIRSTPVMFSREEGVRRLATDRLSVVVHSDEDGDVGVQITIRGGKAQIGIVASSGVVRAVERDQSVLQDAIRSSTGLDTIVSASSSGDKEKSGPITGESGGASSFQGASSSREDADQRDHQPERAKPGGQNIRSVMKTPVLVAGAGLPDRGPLVL